MNRVVASSMVTLAAVFLNPYEGWGKEAGPNGSNPQSAPGAVRAGKVIGLSIAGSDRCYDAAAGVFEAEAKEEGWKVMRSYADYKREKELVNIDEFIGKKVDAMAIITTDIKTGGEAAKRCNEAGIPVFFMFFTPDLSNGAKATSIVTTDWYSTGFVNAKYIAKRYPNAKCAIVEGGYDQGITELMRQGFLDGLKAVKHSHARLIANYSGSWMKPNAMVATEELLEKYPDFDCIFAGNEEMLLGIVDVLKSKDLLGRFHLFAENGREDVGVKYLKEGILQATAGAPTTADGEIGFQLIRAYFAHKPVPLHVNNPVTLLTKDNVQDAVPWDTQAFMALKKQGKIVFDYTKLEIVTRERPWSTAGNNYDTVLFRK